MAQLPRHNSGDLSSRSSEGPGYTARRRGLVHAGCGAMIAMVVMTVAALVLIGMEIFDNETDDR